MGGKAYRYKVGEIPSRYGGKHTIVVKLAAKGNTNAGIRASELIHHFENIQQLIMVGIAGGVPHPEVPSEHVRLGDIVVSNEKGVIQYDFVKETEEKVIEQSNPRPPNRFLLDAVNYLEAERLNGQYPWLDVIKKMHVPCPSEDKDILWCSEQKGRQIPHPEDPKRKPGQSRVFIGPIASANTLLQNPLKRDSLRDKYGVKAVEMEGFGVADATWNHEIGYLVVRGICNYCNSNDNTQWQDYAAAAAAAYTRALLESMPVCGM